ncbi:MAG: DoxX family protein [Cytophagaceae bacterium]|nr:DoxX family protein [Cytophagaceae bacterium]
MKLVAILLQLVISVIVGQTLFFKFSGAEESIYIFKTLGVELWGRIALGTMELVSVILLWIPCTKLYALIIAWGMMTGAIASHLFVLGIEIKGDGGELFILGIVTWVSSAVVLFIKRDEVKALVMKFLAKKHVL